MAKNCQSNEGTTEIAGQSPKSKRSRRREWQSTPVFCLDKFSGQRSLAGCSLWSQRKSWHNSEWRRTCDNIFVKSLVYSLWQSWGSCARMPSSPVGCSLVAIPPIHIMLSSLLFSVSAEKHSFLKTQPKCPFSFWWSLVWLYNPLPIWVYIITLPSHCFTWVSC